MKKLIIVSDWGVDTLSMTEVKIAILGFLNSDSFPDITFVNSTTSTIHASFLTEQIVTTEERLGDPMRTVIFQNVDPRILPAKQLTNEDDNDEIIMNENINQFLHKLILIKLYSGMWIFGPNAKFNFSLIKNKVEKVYFYPDFEKGGQFRSRDLYSRICAHFLEEKENELDLREIPNDVIPSLNGFYIGHIDNFGNIKTTIKKSQLKGKVEFGQVLKVKINNTINRVTYVRGLFVDKPNKLLLYPGSSGEQNDPYLEISVWRTFENKDDQKTGSSYFNHPVPGDKIELIFR